jgi:hypothetical protein
LAALGRKQVASSVGVSEKEEAAVAVVIGIAAVLAAV